MFFVVNTFIEIAINKGSIKNTAIVKPNAFVVPNLLTTFLIVYILNINYLF